MLLVAGRGRGGCPQQEDPVAGGGPGEVGGEARHRHPEAGRGLARRRRVGAVSVVHCVQRGQSRGHTRSRGTEAEARSHDAFSSLLFD